MTGNSEVMIPVPYAVTPDFQQRLYSILHDGTMPRPSLDPDALQAALTASDKNRYSLVGGKDRYPIQLPNNDGLLIGLYEHPKLPPGAMVAVIRREAGHIIRTGAERSIACGMVSAQPPGSAFMIFDPVPTSDGKRPFSVYGSKETFTGISYLSPEDAKNYFTTLRETVQKSGAHLAEEPNCHGCEGHRALSGLAQATKAAVILVPT